MPEYAQIDLFVYKAKIFRNRFVTIGWFNQINYMRGRRQDRILFLIGSSPAGGLFLFLPAGLSNIKTHIESLTCIKGEDTHIADFTFSGKSGIGTLIFLRPCQALKVPDRNAGRCILPLPASGGQGKPSLELLVEIALYRPLLPCQY